MTATPTVVPRVPATAGALVATGVGATALASATTPVAAAAGRAAGISLDVGGAPIPVLGFATLTSICSLVGLVLAVVLSRTVRRPRTAFVRSTVVLTVLSLVPDVVVDATTPTKALLMLTHLVAAAIVVPAVARRLAD